MDYKEKYRKAFNHFYDSAIKNEWTSQVEANSHITRPFRRWIIAVCSLVLLLSGATLAAAATGLISFAEIFRTGFHDEVSALLAESDTLQELDIANENNDFVLKLIAFTGDKETHKVIFELIPKKDLGDISAIKLYAGAFCPCTLEDGSYTEYGTSEVEGYVPAGEADKNTFYFSYQLPPYWVRDSEEDIVLRISGGMLYNGDGIPHNLIYEDMFFRFTPDRSILKPSYSVEVNQLLTKEVYNSCYFTDNYDNPYAYKGEITAPLTERSIEITKVTFSEYKTTVNAQLMDEDITDKEAGTIWNQFTEPRFITEHYPKGIEEELVYELAPVENDKRIRLFADGVEIEVDQDSLKYQPGRGHIGNVPKTEGKFGCAVEFAGFDYENAQSIEIHFGDTVITIK